MFANLSSTQKKAILKCKEDPVWFIENFCQITHPSAGIIPMKLFNYQKKSIKTFREPKNRYCIYHKVRQSGISTLSGVYALWYAMFNNDKTVLIVSKKDDDAKDFLRKNIRFVYDFLPEWMRSVWSIEPEHGGNNNAHEMVFPNGSRIVSLTAAPTVMRSHSASLYIIDEAAFIQDMDRMWEGAAPTLTHGGRCIIISCVPKGTYVFTNNGMQKIDNFIDDSKPEGEGYWINQYQVLGKDKLRSGSAFFNSGRAETRKFSTRYGSIEGSINHKLWACKDGKFDWYKMSDLDTGDWISMQYGMNAWGNDDDTSDFSPSVGYRIKEFSPKLITNEIAYLIGLYLAEGSCYRPSYAITLTCGDDISKAINDCGLTFSLSKDKLHYAICSKNFVEYMEYLGFDLSKRASEKEIPERLLRCSSSVIKHMLRGMFDGDGFCSIKGGKNRVGYASTSEKMIEQIRLLLLNFGILSTQSIRNAVAANSYISECIENGIQRKITRHNHDLYRLEMSESRADLYHEIIGFGFERKQNNKNKICKLKPNRCDVIPHSVDLCQKMFEKLPFGTWVLNKKYGLQMNGVLNKTKRYKTEHVSRNNVIKLAEISSEYLDSETKDYIFKIVDKNMIWVPIEEIDIDFKEVYDFSLPDNSADFWDHSVVYNGFLGQQTPNGMGNWYYRTVRDSQANKNDFKLIQVNWWDMDWQITFKDEFGNQRTIAPTLGLNKCETPDDIAKYGEFKSPWLEEQYKMLSSDGDDKKFRQEVLHEFLGTGNTILTRETLARMGASIQEPIKQVGEIQYKNPSTEEVYLLDFKEKLWIWERPVTGDPKKGVLPHIYTLGADCSPGEGDGDPSAIVIWDLNTRKQVAELELRVDTKTFAKMIDFLGRTYNNALVIIERDAWGTSVIKELTEVLVYNNLYRHIKEKNNLRKVWEKYGYPTGTAQKSVMNANMVQCLSNVGGFQTKSSRFCREAEIYIQINAIKVGAEPGHGNHDDLIIAGALGLVAVPQAIQTSNPILIPMESRNIDDFFYESMESTPNQINLEATVDERISKTIMEAGRGCMIPFIGSVDSEPTGDYRQNAQREIIKFAKQLGQVPLSINNYQGAVVIPRKYFKK